MRRTRQLQAALAMVACLAVVSIAGCGSTGDSVPSAAGAHDGGGVDFPTVSAFDYQLGSPYTPSSGVELVVRDRTASPADGLYSICYVNAFQTQPGERDQWPDEVLLTADGAPVFDADWPDEILLYTSTSSKREAILDTASSWIQGCADAGFEAVEFDNLDSLTRSHDVLTVDDNLALARALVDIAHAAGLAAGQKNSAEYTARLKSEAGLDFAIAEECAAYNECTAYTDAYGDAVIDIEYADTLPRSFAEMCEDTASPRAMILRDRDLVTPDDDGYVFRTCAH